LRKKETQTQKVSLCCARRPNQVRSPLAGEFPLSQSNKAANKLPVESTTALSLSPPCIIYRISNFTFVLFVIGFGSINKIARRRRKQSERPIKNTCSGAAHFLSRPDEIRGRRLEHRQHAQKCLDKFRDTSLMQRGNSPAASVFIRPVFANEKGAGCLPDARKT
jgi:hypothetical protein